MFIRRVCNTTADKEHSEGGYTLVELLVTMIIISILSLGIVSFFTGWLQVESLAQSRSDLLLTAENALDMITNDIKLSGEVDINNRWADQYAPGGSYGWASGSQVLVLAKIATDKSNNVIYSDASKYISQKDNEVYFLSGTTLYRRTLQSDDPTDAAVTTCPAADASPSCPADTVVATGVSNFSVTYYDADENIVAPSSARSVQLSITISSSTGGKKTSATYATRMVFRND
jgi:prepilin-type N-terminal cleavage/methylation domain-containing protein